MNTPTIIRPSFITTYSGGYNGCSRTCRFFSIGGRGFAHVTGYTFGGSGFDYENFLASEPILGSWGIEKKELEKAASSQPDPALNPIEDIFVAQAEIVVATGDTLFARQIVRDVPNYRLWIAKHGLSGGLNLVDVILKAFIEKWNADPNTPMPKDSNLYAALRCDLDRLTPEGQESVFNFPSEDDWTRLSLEDRAVITRNAIVGRNGHATVSLDEVDTLCPSFAAWMALKGEVRTLEEEVDDLWKKLGGPGGGWAIGSLRSYRGVWGSKSYTFQGWDTPDVIQALKVAASVKGALETLGTPKVCEVHNW